MLDHWVQIAQFHGTQGISGKHQGHAGSLGIPGMHSCFYDFVLTLAFSSSRRLSTPGVLKCKGEKTGVQRMAVIQRVRQDTDGNLVLSNSASVLLAHVGSYIVGNSSFCGSCKAELISGNFSDPNLHPPEIPQISRGSAHLGIKKLSIYLVHSHLSGFWPKVKGLWYFPVSPFTLEAIVRKLKLISV